MPMPPKQVECICEECGQHFWLKASLARNRRFCSWKCKTKHDASLKVTVQCPNCGIEFETYKKNRQKYCSISCAVSARNRTDKNPSKHRDISGENNPMYGKGYLIEGENNPMFGKYEENNPAWTGGKKTRADGYVMIRQPNHPHASDGYVLEHRLVMEGILGRYLTHDEVVHHIDGNPSNNDPNNLELFASQSDHIHIGHGDR